jgi:hypothetical protein
MKIFWAWQSDTPGNIGRFFVRDTFRAAIDQLKAEAEIVEPTERETRDAMELDYDRKNVSGSPDLARTILEKIENATVFVADVTPVGIVLHGEPGDDKKAEPKKVINSNVAIELGYSLRARTDRSLLMVMNAHYGTRADLPFDLIHKAGPFMFDLAPDADKKTIAAAGAKLKPQLVEAIRLCIADEVNEKKQQQPFDTAKPSAGLATFFSSGEILASAGDRGEQEFHFPYERIAYMRIHPVSGNVAVGRARISDRAEHSVDLIAVTALEIIPAEVAVAFHVPDHRLDGRAASEFALDGAESSARRCQMSTHQNCILIRRRLLALPRLRPNERFGLQNRPKPLVGFAPKAAYSTARTFEARSRPISNKVPRKWTRWISHRLMVDVATVAVAASDRL